VCAYTGERLRSVGRASPMKDLAYLLCCAADTGCSPGSSEAHLALYHERLSAVLRSRGAAPEIPPLAELRGALDLAYADLCRWMSGRGYWGDVPNLQCVVARRWVGLCAMPTPPADSRWVHLFVWPDRQLEIFWIGSTAGWRSSGARRHTKMRCAGLFRWRVLGPRQSGRRDEETAIDLGLING
jgi:hypothetical protein